MSDDAPPLAVTRANGRMLAPDGTPPPDAPDGIGHYDHSYLHRAFAPTSVE